MALRMRANVKCTIPTCGRPRFLARGDTLAGSAVNILPYSSQCSLSSAQEYPSLKYNQLTNHGSFRESCERNRHLSVQSIPISKHSSKSLAFIGIIPEKAGDRTLLKF